MTIQKLWWMKHIKLVFGWTLCVYKQIKFTARNDWVGQINGIQIPYNLFILIVDNLEWLVDWLIYICILRHDELPEYRLLIHKNEILMVDRFWLRILSWVRAWFQIPLRVVLCLKYSTQPLIHPASIDLQRILYHELIAINYNRLPSRYDCFDLIDTSGACTWHVPWFQ